MRRRAPRQPRIKASSPVLSVTAMVLTAWPVLAVAALVVADWPVRAAAGSASRPHGSTANLAAVVDTRTWTGGSGHTYPGAQVPLGMVQWSPDTRPGRTNSGGYFSEGARELDGYSLTHVSGAGCAAAGDIPILPMTGARPTGNLNAVTTSFTSKGEVAQAGYYSARSNGSKTITSQFTATPHTAFGRFTFPKTNAADFLIKLDDSELHDFASTAQVIGNDEIAGSESSGNFCGETKKFGHQTYKVYFDLTFSKPFTSEKISTPAGHSDPDAVFVTFDTRAQQVIEARVAISYVSIANARLWDVPNDYAGLFAELGGNVRVRPELRTYLSQPNGRGRFAYLSNEFDLGEQFAPDYAGDPAETQFAVDNIRRNLYRPGPSGFGNNDDLGAESSQFIWEMLGLYPENPGSDILVFASPAFHRITIHLPTGKTITIIGSGAAAGFIYVRSLTINGKPDNKLYVPFASLKAGATLNFSLNRTPTSWGSAPRDAPPSYRAGD